MEHNVEAESEGDNEEGVPDQEQEERLQDFVEHGDVNVIPGNFLENVLDSFYTKSKPGARGELPRGKKNCRIGKRIVT